MTVGLVLGAGGVRGCAHAGVLAVLEEAQVPIDLVVGASVGAIFGLGVAAGLPAARLVQLVQDATPGEMFRFYAGRLTPYRTNPIARLLLDAAEGKEFSDLPFPFAVMATDIETGQPAVLHQGPVLPAVQASIALPFLARPVQVNGRYYLDGGLYNATPVAAAHQMGADRVISVFLGHNYRSPGFLRRRPWTRRVLERWGTSNQTAAGRFPDQLRFGARFLAATYDPVPASRDADVAIWPEFAGVTPNSFFGMRYCYEQGQTAAQRALPEIMDVLNDQPRLENTGA